MTPRLDKMIFVAAFLSLTAATTSFADTGTTRIPLRVDWPLATTEPIEFPVFCGLSFPKDRVRSLEQISLVDGQGRPVAVGVEGLARWTPDKSFKWVGLHFQAARGREYFALLNGPASAASGKLQIQSTPQAIVLDTGAARFELPLTGPLFERVQIGGTDLLAPGQACLLVTDQRGRHADETRSNAHEAPQVEYSDRQFAVVRREGTLQTAAGERLGKYVVRLEFQSGSSTVKLQHSFILTENSDDVQFADLAVRLRPAGGGTWHSVWEPTPGAAPIPLDLDVDSGDAAYLLQADYPHHGQKVSHRELKVRRGAGEFVEVPTKWDAHDGAVGNWAAVETERGGVLIAVPKLAQLFPKELEMGRAGLTAHLWSSRGGRLLDYRAATLVDHYGKEWIDKKYPGGSAAMRTVATPAQGSARTHDVWLHFYAAAGAPAAPQIGRLCAVPPLCIQDPAWMRTSEALGGVHPYAPERFPKLERFLEHFMADCLTGQAERWGDYGFLDYGCGPHYYDDRAAPPGAALPRAKYRYSGNMYHGQTALWQAYARSGKRLYRDYTEAFHRHNADYKFVHFDAPGARHGAQRGGGLAEETPFYWTGHAAASGVLSGHQGRDMEGFLLQLYLTGDRWGVENLLRFGEVFLRDFDPSVLTEIVAYSNGAQPTLAAAALYQHTGDERYLEKLAEIRGHILDVRTLTGWVDTEYYGAWEKFPNKVVGILADYLASDSPRAKQAFEKASRIWLWDLPPNSTGYQDQDGRVCNYAWRLTGDLRYAAYMEERLNRTLFEYLDEAEHFRTVSTSRGGPNQGGTHGFNFFETAFYGMDLLAATEGQRQPYIALDTGVGGQATEVWFAKDWHQPISLELRSKAHPDLQVRWTPQETNRPYRDFHNMPIHWDAYPGYFSKESAGLASGYARADVGVETVAGEYRLLNVPLVFRSSARKLVMVIRDGAVLRATSARPPTWYFQVPAGKPGAIYVNKPVTLKVGQRPIAITPGQWTELSGLEQDQMASLQSTGLVYVAFRGGIPPVLAQHDPSRYFVPREVLAEMPAREQAARQATAAAPSSDPYVAGLTGKPQDRAVLLSGKRTLRIPRGESRGARCYEFIDYREGTLEFWFQPRWSTGGVTANRQLNFITGAFWPCSIRHYRGDDEDPKMGAYFGFTARATQKSPVPTAFGYPPQDLRNVHTVQEGRWHHLAISWATDPQRGWLSEMYLDGKPSLGWARYDVGLGRFLESEKPKYYPPKPWPIDEPQGGAMVVLGEVLNAAIDELRISRSARYPQPFAPLSRRKLDADEETLLLLHCDGNMIPVTPQTSTPPKLDLR